MSSSTAERPGTRATLRQAGLTPNAPPLTPPCRRRHRQVEVVENNITQHLTEDDSYETPYPTETETVPTAPTKSLLMSDSSRHRQKPGAAPTLYDRTSAALQSFFLKLDFFFKLSKDKINDKVRTMYVGNGIEEEELAVWYLGAEEELTALSWGEFKTVFLRRALPTGYLWDVLAHVRGNHQGSRLYIDWSTEL
jgi:hypothetical protein